jgi:inner membrane protein
LDNVTHTLAGLLVAEMVVRGRRTRQPLTPAFVPAAFWVSALANNLPDFDFLYSGLTGGKLGYLLHHRGHTHTLAFVPVASAVLMGATLLWARRRAHPLQTRDWQWLFGLSVAGPLLHLLLDATNNYGVHPFWPADTRWFYGDGIFIIEPYLLFCGAAGLVFSARSRLGRGLLWLLVAGVLGAVWTLGYVPSLGAAVITSFLVALLVVARALRPVTRAALCLGLWVLVTAAFFVGRGLSRKVIAHDRADRTGIDVVLTPLPATPLCWTALILELDGEDYVVTRSTVALWPELVDTEACSARTLEESTAPMQPVRAGGSPRHALHEEFRAPARELRNVAHRNCRASAFLRFARAPFWTNSILGDLRYDREAELGFAEIELPKPDCPRFVPGWTPPRSDLL